jgi:hypothetical protein
MIIVTGASNNHYLTLINMINSYIKNANEHTLIVYNLGLDNDKWLNIQTLFLNNNNIIYKIFDYSKYPEWFNINIGAGQYAWKPTIIYNTFLEYENQIIVWMDSGNLITSDIILLEQVILDNSIYSWVSSGDIKKWTHPETIKYLNCNCLNEQNRNAACLGFNTNIDFVKEFLLEFYNCAQTKECIFPDGSSRDNHRQAQAVFTVLFYKYKNLYNFNHSGGYDWQYHIGYSIHNDVD